MPRIVTFGEMLLRLQAPGLEAVLRSGSFEAFFGGSEINVAVGAAHLGAETVAVTVLPENDLGERALETLRAHGVSPHAPQMPGRMGLYFAERGRPPRPARVIYDRAGSVFAEHQDWSNTVRWHDVLTGADWFHTSGITPPLSSHAHRNVADGLAAARTAGVRSCFDLNYRGALWADEAACGTALRPLLEGVDLLVANAFHLQRCFGLDVSNQEEGLESSLRRACDELGVSSLALTDRGERNDGSQDWSASLYLAGNLTRSPSWRILPVERIGGGDAFTAALLVALAKDMDKDEAEADAVSFASACGALKLTEPGDWSTASAADVRLAQSGATTGIRR